MFMQNVQSTYNYMRNHLGRLVPDWELRIKAELVVEITALKKEKNAIILGHNYMEPALYHTVCDFKGDSLELARRSATTDADLIVFCGVEFMAETAKILNPSKKVLIPSQRAGCSLASSITAQDVRALKAAYPGTPVVTYINSYAEVKAETDICCTSGNAVRVVASLQSDKVIFIPDEFLAQNVANETGKKLIIPLKESPASIPAHPMIEPVMIGWHGRCEVHEKFTVEDIKNIRKQFPNVTILAHPECSLDVCQASDFSGSTSAMISYVKNQAAKEYLLLTECSMADNIIAENPEKNVLRLCSIRCPHMSQITLEMTLSALQEEKYEVFIDEQVRIKAKKALDRMLAIG